MLKQLSLLGSLVLLLGLILPVSCSKPIENQEKTNTEKPVSPKDAGGSDNTPTDQPKTSGNWPPPAGYAAIEFKVDDSANKTYKDKQLLWNGSFVYDSKTNIIKYAAAWQPTDGPFPPLYDDGPIDKGGHEPIGSTAGDHIFGIVVFAKAEVDKEIEFEYGVINEDNNWIWEGPNGTVTLKQGSTEVLKAPGLVISKHGVIDIKITLDLKKLPQAFTIDDPTNPPPIFIKGIHTNWGHIQVLDKGSKGDETAGDGILTYIQSQNLDYSPHLGLLPHKRHVQFVFQFNSVTGREYKDADDKAIKEGVEAWADCNGDGKFTPDEKHTIIWEKDSRGAVQNTTIIVCENSVAPCEEKDCGTDRCKDKPICQQKKCTKDEECKADETCDTASGKCVPKGAACTKQDCATTRCKDDPVCKCKLDSECGSNETCNTQTGQCIAKQKCQKKEDCPPDHNCDKSTGRCLLIPCTAQDCQQDRCKQDPICNNTQNSPIIYFVTPGAGPLAGGTEITLSGERFKQGIKIQFGGKDASDIKWVSAERVTCKSPAGAQKGFVDVSVINTDGQRNTYPQGYKYDDSAVDIPRVTEVKPARGDIAGGIEVTLLGRNFKTGLKVQFENKAATDVKVISSTEATCKIPPNPAGKVAVTVENTDGQKDTLLDAFEYYEKNPKADWGRIVSAASIQGVAGTPLDLIYCQVYDAAMQTKNPGAAKNLKAQTGWGPQGDQPDKWPTGNWVDSTFHKDSGNNDEYKASLTIPKAGTYNFACRFSVDNGQNWLYADADLPGSNNGYDPKDAGVVKVIDSSALSLASVEPPYGLATGGNVVILRGGGFTASSTVTFGSTAATKVTYKSKTELEVTVPAGSAQSGVDIKVTENAQTVTLQGGFTWTGTKATVDWCNTQWPKAMPDSTNNIPDATVNTPTTDIYGWVYKKGATDSAGQGQGVVAHVGYGPESSDPGKDARWRWFPATYNGDKPGVGNPTANDEYKGKVTPHAAGTYHYAFRFSGDNGVNFWHCTLSGNDDKTPYDSTKAAKMTAK